MAIISQYAQNVGAIVVNLATRGYMVKIVVETDVFEKKNLVIQVSEIRKGVVKSIKHMLPEIQVTDIVDPAVIADALADKLRRV